MNPCFYTLCRNWGFPTRAHVQQQSNVEILRMLTVDRSVLSPCVSLLWDTAHILLRDCYSSSQTSTRMRRERLSPHFIVKQMEKQSLSH